jgi:hypothetical protein
MKQILVLTLILFSLVIPVFAQNDNKEAITILNRLYCPAGQAPVNDIVIEYEQMDSSGKAAMSLGSKDKIYFKQPVKIRVDSVLVDPGNVNDGKNLIVIRDGINAWLYLSTGQYPVKKKLDEPSPPLNLPFGLTHYPEDLNRKYKIEGREKIEGVNALKISFKDPQNDHVNTDVWIDTQRCVPVQFMSIHTVKYRIKKGTKEEQEKERHSVKKVIYKDFGQTKDGRYFPMKLEKYIGDDLSTLIIYKGIKVNSDLQDHLFEPMEKILR